MICSLFRLIFLIFQLFAENQYFDALQKIQDAAKKIKAAALSRICMEPKTNKYFQFWERPLKVATSSGERIFDLPTDFLSVLNTFTSGENRY